MSPVGKIAREYLRFEPMEISGSIWKTPSDPLAAIEDITKGPHRKIQVMIYIDSSGSMERNQPELFLYVDRLVRFVRAHTSAALEVGIGRFEDGRAEALLPPTPVDEAGLARITGALLGIKFGAGQGIETAGTAFANARVMFNIVPAEVPARQSASGGGNARDSRATTSSAGERVRGNDSRSVIILSDDEADFGRSDRAEAIETRESGIQTLYIDDLKRAMPNIAMGGRQTSLSIFTELKGQIANYLKNGGDQEALKRWAGNSPIFLLRLAAASALSPDEGVLSTIENVRMDPEFHRLLNKRNLTEQRAIPYDCDPKKRRCEFLLASSFLYLDIWRQIGTPELQAKAALDAVIHGIHYYDTGRPTPLILYDVVETLRTLDIEPSTLVETIFRFSPLAFAYHSAHEDVPFENGSTYLDTILPNPDDKTVNDIIDRISSLFDRSYDEAIAWWRNFRYLPRIRDSDVIMAKILAAVEEEIAHMQHDYVIRDVFEYSLFDEATRERLFSAGLKNHIVPRHPDHLKGRLSLEFIKDLARYGLLEKKCFWGVGWYPFNILPDDEKLAVAGEMLGNAALSEDSRRYIDAHLLAIQKDYANALLLSFGIFSGIKRSHQYIKDGYPAMTIDVRSSIITRMFEEFYDAIINRRTTDEYAAILNELALKPLARDEHTVFQEVAKKLINEDMELFCHAAERIFGSREIAEKTKLWLLVVATEQIEANRFSWHVHENPEEQSELDKKTQKYLLDRAMGKKERYDNWRFEGFYEAKLVTEILVKIATDRGLSDELRRRSLYSLQIADRPSGFAYSKDAIEALANDTGDPLHETIVSTLKVMEDARPVMIPANNGKDTTPPDGQ